MPYNKSTSAAEVNFQVIPEEAPSLLKAVIIPMALPLLLLWVINFKIGLIAIIILGAWIYIRQNGKSMTKYRAPGNFSAAPMGININGKFYGKADIHRLTIRNHVNEGYLFVSDYDSYHAPVSTATALQLRKRLVDVSYRVDMESNGNVVTLAGGLTEPTAYAILSDTAKIIDYKIK